LHFRDAAAIGMSQPALSGAVAPLEDTLGVTLLKRTTRKVLLSPAGERLAVRAKAVLEEVGALLAEAEAVRAPFTGALRLGVIPTVAPYSLGGRSGIPREALRELHLLLLDEGHCLRDQALDICREAGRADAPVTTTAAGLSTLVQLVAGGLGVTLLPRTAVRVETTRNDRLLAGYFTEPAPTRRIALAMRTGAARRAEYQELAAALREALRPLPVRVLGTGN